VTRAPSVLVFYPFFPTYRQSILESLETVSDANFHFVAGVRGRAGITSLTESNFPALAALPTRRLGSISVNPGVVRLALRSEYDSVIVAPATLSLSVWAVLLLRAMTGKRTYLWGQCGKPAATGLKRFAQEVMNRLATGLLVYGESEQIGATAWGTRAAKVHIVNNAVEHTSALGELGEFEFYRLLGERGIGKALPEAEIRMTYIGRVSHEKRIDSFLEALVLLREEFPRLKATIVGEGAARVDIQERVSREGLPVEVLGAIHDAKRLEEIFARTTVVVAPSEIGLLAVQSLQHAVPVLYGDNPLRNGSEVEALTLNINAGKFRPADPDAIAESVASWLRRAPDMNVREYREATLSALTRWSPQSVAGRIVAVVR